MLLFWGYEESIEFLTPGSLYTLSLGLCFGENRISSVILFLLLNTQTASDESKGQLSRRAFSHLCGLYIFVISVYYSFAHNSFAFHIPSRIDFLQAAVNVLDDIMFGLQFRFRP